MRNPHYIAIDFETRLISDVEAIPHPICLSTHDKNGSDLYVGMDEMRSSLQKIFNDPYNYVIAHNATFELNVIDKHFPEFREQVKEKLEQKKIICTKIVEQLIDNTSEKHLKSFSLAAIVELYLKKDISEDKKDKSSWRYRYHELEGKPKSEWPKEAIDYAIDDSIYAYNIYVNHQKTADVEYAASVEAEFYLNKMGLNGTKIDHDRVNQLEAELLADLNPNYAYLSELGLTELKKGKYSKKMKNFREYIAANLDPKIIDYTAKDVVSTTTESVLKYLAFAEDEKVKKTFQVFLDIMGKEKILTAFVARLKTVKDLIRTNYNAAVSSGRTSSSSSDFFPSVNIQQMPREVEGVTWDIRNCFVPRKGYNICSIDYNGLELAAAAHRLKQITGMSHMADLLNSGTEPSDLHSMLAVRFKNMKESTKVTYEEFLKFKKKDGYKEYREVAKKINLGFPGGIGYDTIRTQLAREGIFPKIEVLETARWEERLKYALRVTRDKGYPTRIRRSKWNEYQLVYDELVALKREFFNLYPDLEYFLSEGHHKFMTGKKKRVLNEFNEWEMEPMYQFTFCGFKRDWCTYTKFCNGTLMQSPSAIGAKKALVEVVKKYGNSKEVIPTAFIHDEIVFEVIDDKDLMPKLVEDVSKIMIDNMQKVLYNVRIAVEAEVFPYWKKAGGFYTKQYWKNIKEDRLYEK